MERLRDSLHFIDQDEDNEEEDEEEAPTKKSNHVVFVDSQDEGIRIHVHQVWLYAHSLFWCTAKKFDPVKHLDTVPELVNRKFNRPRIETLKKNPILAPENAASLKVLYSISWLYHI